MEIGAPRESNKLKLIQIEPLRNGNEKRNKPLHFFSFKSNRCGMEIIFRANSTPTPDSNRTVAEWKWVIPLVEIQDVYSNRTVAEWKFKDGIIKIHP